MFGVKATFLNRFFNKYQSSTVSYLFFRFLNTSTHSKFIDEIENELKNIKESGTYKNERIISSKQEMEVQIEGNPSKLINFCANNYLGLSANQQLIDAGKNLLQEYGAGLSSVRFICGTQTIHKKLEKKIADFHGREDSILYSSCFDANAGLFEVITNSEDAIISDELNHASIIDGIRLSKARRLRYKHMDINDLEQQLFQTKNCRRRVIVTDGVFSMDGDIAPIADIVNIAKQYKAIVMVDDCHATGFIGKTGRGTEEAFKILGTVDIINSTLGKALGGAMGGYTTGSHQLIELLRQRSRPSLFSNSLPPGVVGISLEAINILSKNNNFATKLRTNVSHFRNEMKKLGFVVLGNFEHPICPVLVGDAKLASDIANAMLVEKIYVIGFSYPVVPKQKARIRVQISAAHSIEQIDKCIRAFKKVGQHFKIID